jgi:uncharacterized protein YaiL (DUF2058 family)
MSDSLRDQLLKAGLVTENKVKTANQADEQRRRQLKSGGKRRATDVPPDAAQRAKAQKVVRDLELNHRQQEKAQRRALRAQVEQLVEQARLPRLESDNYYSFVDGGKVRRIAVDAERRRGICEGKLTIVRYKGLHEVVPAEAAQRIRERDESALIVRDEESKAAPEDDPYKDFVVPDDLTW